MKRPPARKEALLKRLRALLNKPQEELTRLQSLFVSTIHVMIQAWKRLAKGDSRLYAGMLAYKTLLTLIPALAIATAVLSSDAFAQRRNQLLDQVVDALYPAQSASPSADNREILRLNQESKRELRAQIQKLAAQAGSLGAAGTLVLALVVLSLMRDVEGAFNALWGIPRKRHFLKQFLRHALVILLLPLAAMALLHLRDMFFPASPGGPPAWVTQWLAPYLVFFAACLSMFLFLPNTRVRWKSALGAAALTAFLLEAARFLFAWSATGALGYSRIYGTLSVLPIVMVWLYISWSLVLFGAEIAFILQNRRQVAGGG